MPRNAQAQPRLSVIIVNLNTRQLLHACLRSLQAALTSDDVEVIVVDNGSADDSCAMVANEFPQVHLIALRENRGFAVANNLGMRAARGRYFLVLNSDTEIIGDALNKICDFMDAHPEVGALGPKLLNTDGTLQYSCRRFPSFRTALFHRYSLMTRLFPRNRFSSEYLMTDVGHDRTMDVDWVSGAALVVRREIFESLGGFDEGFFMYAEDVDWCYRIKQAGWRVVYLPEAQILHHIGQSTRLVPYAMTLQRHRSMWRFYRKHYSRGIVLVDVATFCGIAIRCGVMMLRTWLIRHLRRQER
ncbi:MAG: glycosyltransferase family 2 protein [Candidatus Sumerlaeaceae bacterium]|nr:glycosyltransferase family 2 protein [Candidatus Sumerlaeaceae bacterium]